jgi:hypothetical protein
MPPITALLHTTNDALRVGRTLETLLPCAEILIVDHHSRDSTQRIAREYGARIVSAENHQAASQYLAMARHNWILCIDPWECITEGLQASLFEWTVRASPESIGAGSALAYSLLVRKQTGEGWHELSAPETRLVPRTWTRWAGHLPASASFPILLEGELLRFNLP